MEHRSGPHAAADRKVLVLRGLHQEEVFQLLKLLRIRGGQIVRLVPISIDVVEFPFVSQRAANSLRSISLGTAEVVCIGISLSACM